MYNTDKILLKNVVVLKYSSAVNLQVELDTNFLQFCNNKHNK